MKALGFFGQTNLNPFKNIACQPIKGDFGSHTVNFGNIQSQAVNEHGDSVSFSTKNSAKQELPLTFGQKFVEAAIKVSKQLKGNNDTGRIGKELGKELYGVEIN